MVEDPKQRGKHLLRELYYAKRAADPKLSQAHAAKDIGIGRSTFVLNLSLNDGGRPISPEAAIAYGRYFGVPAQDFITTDSKP